MKSLFVQFKSSRSYILDLIYPPKCIFCNTILSPGTELEICDSCYERIPFIQGKACSQCGQPIEGSYGSEQCLDC
ncbi:MAG: double zinc ribbon domain-containing protein, partial [Clostridia bacterium]